MRDFQLFSAVCIRRGFICTVLLFIFVFSSIGVCADWPNYRGPDYNGISGETDWNSSWGDNGPKKLWQKSVGIGFSSIAVADGRVYTMGNTGKKTNTDIVYCFDAKTGTELWTHSYACALEPKYYEGGTLSTPTVDGKYVYTLSKMGDMFCLDAVKGNVIWHKDFNKMKYKLPTWHFSSSLLIQGNKVILNIGTAGLALDKTNGKIIWSTGKDICGYATPVPFTMGGKSGLALFAEKSIIAVNPDTGKEMWQYPWKTKYEVNAADPIISGNHVFITSGYGKGGCLLQVKGNEPTKIWQSKVLAAHMNCAVLWQGYVYGFSEKYLKCFDLLTGKEQWKDKSMGKGSLCMSADARLIILSDKGELVIAQADPSGFEVLARAQVLPRKRCWTVPVLANGCIYARNARGDLVCLDVH